MKKEYVRTRTFLWFQTHGNKWGTIRKFEANCGYLSSPISTMETRMHSCLKDGKPNLTSGSRKGGGDRPRTYDFFMLKMLNFLHFCFACFARESLLALFLYTYDQNMLKNDFNCQHFQWFTKSCHILVRNGSFNNPVLTMIVSLVI